MPWGVHKDKPMQDVPARYLHFLWTERGLSEDHSSPVAAYIRENLAALQMEYEDGIWD